MSFAFDSHRGGDLSPEFVLLGFPAAGPGYSYDLHQQFAAELGHVWHLGQSQGYAILNRLESRGDISAHVVEQHKLPARQTLRITSSGRRRFTEWLESGVSTHGHGMRQESLTRLYFVQRYYPQKAVQIHDAHQAEIKRGIEHLETLLAGLTADQIFKGLSLELRLRRMKLVQTSMNEVGTESHIRDKAPI
jgi:DNA-binding PadR family transcriptional regulator